MAIRISDISDILFIFYEKSCNAQVFVTAFHKYFPILLFLFCSLRLRKMLLLDHQI